MKRIVLFFVSLLMIMPTIISNSLVEANSAYPFNTADKKPTSGTYYRINYWDNKKEQDPVDITVIYDSKGRIFDDGVNYHLYDGNGHEIMTSIANDVFALFGINHFYWGNEYRAEYNSDGSPSYFKMGVQEMSFSYDSRGNIKTIDHIYIGCNYQTTFEYSGDKVSRAINRQLNGASWAYTTTFDYQYSGDRISDIICDMASGNRSHYVVGNVSYQYSGDKLVSIEYRSGYSNELLNDAVYFAYDDKGRLATMEGYHNGEGEEGWIVYYNSGGKPKKHIPSEVSIVEWKPKSGTEKIRMYGQIIIGFSHVIKNIDTSRGEIALYDSRTNEKVYVFERMSRSEKVLNLYPSAASITDKFKLGHSYYLKVDEGVLEFEGTSNSIYIGRENKGKNNRYWEVDLSGDLSGTFHFTSTENFDSDTFREGTANFHYSPGYFKESSEFYNGGLATLSMDMAIASYNYKDNTQGDKYIKEFFKALQFEKIESNSDYTMTPQESSAGVCIAAKKLDNDTTLVAIAIRSGNYQSEWYDNFQVGNAVDHAGFSRGRQKAISFLEYFLDKYNIQDHVKFWIAGYSRGSAIANLTAAYLDRGEIVSDKISYTIPDDIYAYCFEVPASTRSGNSGDYCYSNIYNIVNPYDIVVRMPLTKWGFTRYGKVLILPYDQKTGTYRARIDTVRDKFEDIYGTRKKDLPGQDHINGLNALMNILYNSVPSLEKYNIFVEKGLGTLVKISGMGKGKLQRFEEPPLAVLSIAYLGISIGGPITTFDQLVRSIKRMWSEFKLTGLDLDNLLFMHYAEFTLAWMETLDYYGYAEEYYEDSTAGMNSRYANVFVKVHCPVNVSIYDQNYNLLATITDEKAVVENDEPIDAYIDETGAKVFALPANVIAHAVIEATDSGEMNINIISQDQFSGEILYAQDYQNLALEKGKQYSMDIDVGYDCLEVEADLYDSEEDYVSANNIATGESISTHDINIEIEGFGAVSAPAEAVDGDYAAVIAIPENRNKFIGWFDVDGNEVSKESTMILMVNEDVQLTARFTEKDPESNPALLYGGIGIGVVAVIGIAFIVLKKKK